MRIILEELKPQLFKRKEGGSDPIPVSRILSKEGRITEPEQMSKIVSLVDRFFGEKANGFTYEKFNKLIKPKSLASEKDARTPFVFGIGSQERQKVEQFAKAIQLEQKDGRKITYYDEYVETFFMYFYYQLFVKLFSNTDIIIKKNEEAINNAKKIMSQVKDSLKADTDQGLENLYRVFYSSFASSMADPRSLIAGNEQEMVKYFENFANQNIELFVDYPLSEFLSGTRGVDVEGFVSELFDSMEVMKAARNANKQITSINLLSDFIKGNEIEFDVVNLQNKIGDLQRTGNVIKFPSDVQKLVDDMIEELSSLEDISEIGMSWAKGTKWEPYIKLLCGIICLEEVSDSVKSIAKKMKGTTGTYTKVIDAAEADGGLYFINAKAFSKAISEVKELSNIVKDLNMMMEEMKRKTILVYNANENDLIEMLFESYPEELRAIDSEFMEKSKRDSIEKILEITGLKEELGEGTMTGVVSKINYTLFGPKNQMPTGSLSVRNQEAIEDATINVADAELNEVRKQDLKFFAFSDTWKSIKEATSSVKNALVNAFNDTFGEAANDKGAIDNLISSFNSEFSTMFDFATMQRTSEGGLEIVSKRKKGYSIKFQNVEDFQKYVQTMCSSLASIMYHSKVCFPIGQDSGQKYQRYFNVLSWFIRALEKQGKSLSVKGDQYPFTYLITPFFLETVKYSLRAYINDIHNVLDLDKDLKKKIQDSRNKSTMEEDEWKELVERLSKEIEKKLRLKA